MKKMLVIILILMFIFSSFTTIATTSREISYNFGINNPIDLKKGDGETEYWALCYDYFGTWDSQLLKEVLCHNGWEEDHIKIIPHEGVTKQDFINYIKWLDEREDEDDVVLVCIHTHGSKSGLFQLPDEWMSWWELNREINKLESNSIAILIQTCFSGRAIPFLRKNGRVIITSSSAKEASSGCLAYYRSLGLSGIADYVSNNDGIVAAEEVYNYFKIITFEHDPPYDQSQHPCIQDDYPGQLKLVFLPSEDTNVDQKQVYDVNCYGGGLNPQVFTVYAQSFIPWCKSLSKIKIFIIKGQNYELCNNPTLSFSIRTEKDGKNLTSVNVSLDSTTPEMRPLLVECDFPDIQVNPGETYFMIISSNVNIAILGSIGDRYKQGEVYWTDHYTNEWITRTDDLFFITYGYNVTDEASPNIEIINPKKGYLYFSSNNIVPTLMKKTIAIGKINIEVNVNDELSGIDRIEFYIDNKLKCCYFNNSSNVFKWLWGDKTFLKHKHTIKVRVYDNVGNTDSDEIIVWKLF